MEENERLQRRVEEMVKVKEEEEGTKGAGKKGEDGAGAGRQGGKACVCMHLSCRRRDHLLVRYGREAVGVVLTLAVVHVNLGGAESDLSKENRMLRALVTRMQEEQEAAAKASKDAAADDQLIVSHACKGKGGGWGPSPGGVLRGGGVVWGAKSKRVRVQQG